MVSIKKINMKELIRLVILLEAQSGKKKQEASAQITIKLACNVNCE